MTFDAPVVTPARGLDPDWIDHNGHLNMAFYNVLFDKAADQVFELLGCGPAYVARRGLSFFTVEAHLCYVRELRPDATVRTESRILDFDAKRIRLYQELMHAEGWLSATSETLLLHVEMAGPRAAEMPADVFDKVARMAEAHSRLPVPERAGRSIGIARKPTAAEAPPRQE